MSVTTDTHPPMRQITCPQRPSWSYVSHGPVRLPHLASSDLRCLAPYSPRSDTQENNERGLRQRGAQLSHVALGQHFQRLHLK